MDQGIYCKNCGNYERLQFSPDGRYVKCPKCGAETPLYSEYKINEVSIDGFLSQDEKLRNGVKLLELQQYEQAWNVFQELTRERSADYRSWFGQTRAATNDFTVDQALPYDAHVLDNAEYTASSDPEGAQIVAEAKNFYQRVGQLDAEKKDAKRSIQEKQQTKLESHLSEDDFIPFHLRGRIESSWKSPSNFALLPVAAGLYFFYRYFAAQGFFDGTAQSIGVFLFRLFLYFVVFCAGVIGLFGIISFPSTLIAAIKKGRRRKSVKDHNKQIDQRNEQMKKEIESYCSQQERRIAQADQELAQMLAYKPQMLAHWNQVMLNGKALNK